MRRPLFLELRVFTWLLLGDLTTQKTHGPQSAASAGKNETQRGLGLNSSGQLRQLHCQTLACPLEGYLSGALSLRFLEPCLDVTLHRFLASQGGATPLSEEHLPGYPGSSSGDVRCLRMHKPVLQRQEAQPRLGLLDVHHHIEIANKTHKTTS